VVGEIPPIIAAAGADPAGHSTPETVAPTVESDAHSALAGTVPGASKPLAPEDLDARREPAVSAREAREAPAGAVRGSADDSTTDAAPDSDAETIADEAAESEDEEGGDEAATEATEPGAEGSENAPARRSRRGRRGGRRRRSSNRVAGEENERAGDRTEGGDAVEGSGDSRGEPNRPGEHRPTAAGVSQAALPFGETAPPPALPDSATRNSEG
jgi:ribonuclease E